MDINLNVRMLCQTQVIPYVHVAGLNVIYPSACSSDIAAVRSVIPKDINLNVTVAVFPDVHTAKLLYG